MSLIFWQGTTSSGNLNQLPPYTGTPGTFTWTPVPIIQAKDSTLYKEGWVYGSGDVGHAGSQTNVQIVDTNNPIVKGLYNVGQVVQVNSNAQYFSYTRVNGYNGAASGLAPGFKVVATTYPQGYPTIYYADRASSGLITNGTFGGTNYIAHRRVGLWLGDNGGNPAGDFGDRTSDGNTLLMNAINWAIATNEAPFITNAPSSKTVATGSTASFAVTAYGPGPYTYQWFKITGVATNLVGGSYATYITPATVLADSGTQFQVVVTGLAGSVTSSVVTLTVQNPVGIATQPQPATATVGATATFTVTATGTAPAYQWYSNTVAIAGATAASYTTPALTMTASNAQYYVKVSNAVSTTNSATVALTVQNAPSLPPGISGFTRIDSSHLSINWSNGSASSVLLWTTNVTQPMSNWVPVVTNPALPYAITIDPSKGQNFFRVKQ
jgi:hypothetical protein